MFPLIPRNSASGGQRQQSEENLGGRNLSEFHRLLFPRKKTGTPQILLANTSQTEFRRYSETPSCIPAFLHSGNSTFPGTLHSGNSAFRHFCIPGNLHSEKSAFREIYIPGNLHSGKSTFREICIPDFCPAIAGQKLICGNVLVGSIPWGRLGRLA